MIIGLLAASAALGLGACGGDDDATSDPAASSSEADDDGSTGVGDDAGGSEGAGGPSNDAGTADAGDSPFAIPAPDGLVLDALVDAGIELPGSRELHYDNDDYDRVVAFYDDWTSQDGEWRRLETDGSVSYDRLDVDYLQSISVLADFDPGGQGDGPVTCVLLAFG